MTERTLKDIRNALTEKTVDILAGYRKSFSGSHPPGQLVLPENLKELSMYMLGLLKCRAFKGNILRSIATPIISLYQTSTLTLHHPSSRPRTLRPPHPHNAHAKIHVPPRALPPPLPAHPPTPLAGPRNGLPLPLNRPPRPPTHPPRLLLPHRRRRRLPRRRRPILPPLASRPRLTQPPRRPLRPGPHHPRVPEPLPLVPPRAADASQLPGPELARVLGERARQQGLDGAAREAGARRRRV